MSEYSQLQTFIKYNPVTFRNDLQKVESFFSELGFEEELMKNWINEIHWKVEDNGFVYTGCNFREVKLNEVMKLQIRPVVLGMSKTVFKDLVDDILIIEVKFHTDEIYDYHKMKHMKCFVDFAKDTLLIFNKYLFEYGIYLTDEVTDMKPLDVFTSNEMNGLLLFDLAVIPELYANMYCNLPVNYHLAKIEEGVIISSSFI